MAHKKMTYDQYKDIPKEGSGHGRHLTDCTQGVPEEKQRERYDREVESGLQIPGSKR